MAAWDPTINVVDATQIKNNILTFLAANQVEALKWANGGNSGLDAFKDFHKSPRTVTRFPSVMVLQIEHDTKWFDTIMQITFSIVFETALIHGNADTLADMAPKYSMALESMLSNVSETTFNEDSIIDITSTGMDVKTTFDVQGQYKQQFIQVFQTRMNWIIEAQGVN